MSIYAPLDVVDRVLHPVAPAMRAVGYGLFVGVVAMVISRLISPHKRLAAVKSQISESSKALRAYKGDDVREILRLSGRNINLALKQLLLMLGPTAVAAAPVIWVMAWMDHAYTQPVLSFGPNWFRSWEIPFFVGLSIGALIIKFAWKVDASGGDVLKASGDDAFRVSIGRHLGSGIVHHARPVWKWLGDVESKSVREQIEKTPIVAPIYVSGLARSGTSILIEILASHPDVATHQYRDFPFLFIPYWWRRSLDRSPKNEPPAQRAHGDRLVVTSSSPEAMEEVLWMAFFNQLHEPNRCNALGAAATHPEFESFYRDHIRKLLLISNRRRYAAKGNYNLTRMEYLLKLFPDAKFVLAIRRPREHIASLMKQHRLFSSAAERHPRSVAHLDRVGHFEFGAHRKCINPADDAKAIESIESLWTKGEEVRGWARYWANLYTWIDARLAANESLRRATLVLRYEDLCDQPAQRLEQLFQHCDLADTGVHLVARWAPSLSRPDYYQPKFMADEERAIAEETGEVSARFGYSS